MEITRIILSIALALLLLSTGAGKLAGLASSHQIRDSINVSALAWKAVGVFELLIVAGLVVGIWLPWIGVFAALGVIVIMLGAIVTRVRAGGTQRKAGITADAVFLTLGAAAALTGLIR